MVGRLFSMVLNNLKIIKRRGVFVGVNTQIDYTEAYGAWRLHAIPRKLNVSSLSAGGTIIKTY